MVEKSPDDVKGAERLKWYWTKGEGALKIRWGTEGDFMRCVHRLEKFVADAKGLCNTYHVAATGFAPGHAPSEQKPGRRGGNHGHH